MSGDDHPFATETRNPFTGERARAVSLVDRCAMVQRMDYETCRRALSLPGLQRGVVRALEKRIRQLRREGAAPIGDAEIRSQHQEEHRG